MRSVVRMLNSLTCALVLTIATGVCAAAEKVVNVAYQTTYSPWIVAMADGTFERATGYRINWRKFDSGAAVMTAMASGDIDIGVLGSSPLAAAASRGLDIELFWILEDIADAEAFVVRDGSNISTPRDLIGKTIAVPFASTSHYQLMYMLDKWEVTSNVKLVNMSPEQTAAAWARGDVDGAYIWGPALGRIKKTGRPLVTAGQICEMGRCTFEGMTVTKKFASSNPNFMSKFVEILDSSNRDFQEHPDAWGAGSRNITAIIKTLGGDPKEVIEEMGLYKYPSLADQTSCRWLGCGAQGSAAQTLKATAEFLKQQKKIDAVRSDYADAVTTRHAESAIQLLTKK